MLRHPTMAPRQRPRPLNLVMRAMVRTMVEGFNDLPTAYAMDKTKRHFTEAQLRDNNSKAANQWREAVAEYHCLDWRQQAEWRERVVRTHPRMEKIVERG